MSGFVRGFVNINKPSGMTSSDAVVKVRGILRSISGIRYKTGHFGTLDPLAEGVLPIAIGTATKLFDYCAAKRKVYIASFRFGVTTDTLDSAGAITQTCEIIPSIEQLTAVAANMKGDVEQLPPIYSAKSVNGRRAYEYARQGKSVELSPKLVHIEEIAFLEEKSGEYFFRITCGGGTYIRSIVRDMAAKLGTVGYMSSLKRLQSGCFMLEDAVSPEEFAKAPLNYILPIESALGGYSFYELPPPASERILNGVKTQCDNMPEGIFVAVKNKEIIGMATACEGCLKMLTRL